MTVEINDGGVFIKLDSISNIADKIDNSIRIQAIQSVSRLSRSTNRKTGTVARRWGNIQRISAANYSIENDVKTSDKKHNIVEILNDGRGPVYAKPGKKLYIPLSTKGASKKSGAVIPKSFKWGVDYVLKDSVGPFSGTKFIDKEKFILKSSLEGVLSKFMRSL